MPQDLKHEEIVAKLRHVNVLSSQCRSVFEAVRTISLKPFNYYRRCEDFNGLKSYQVKRLKELESFKELEKVNERLRKAVSDLTLEKLILEDTASVNW